MSAFIQAAPRSWRDILVEYHGQPYPVIYSALGNLRPLLGRMNDEPWFRYTFMPSPCADKARPCASADSPSAKSG